MFVAFVISDNVVVVVVLVVVAMFCYGCTIFALMTVSITVATFAVAVAVGAYLIRLVSFLSTRTTIIFSLWHFGFV